MAFITPRVSTGRPRDVTASMPNEILLEIFKLIAQDHVVPQPNNYYEELEDVDMEDETLFPYCLANVCQRWYHVMQAYPEWWSMIRIQMDQFSPDKALSDFRHILDLTKKVQPLQIFVGYSTEDFEVNPEVERELVHGIVAAIQPHMTRYEKIVIHARHGSSLPLISSGVFSGPNPLLRELRLKCDSYPVVQSLPKGKRHIPLPNPVPPCTKSFSIRLTLDGPTFLDACFVPEFWKKLFSGSTWASLNISHVKTDKTVDANRFLAAIFRDDIRHITLEKVELLCKQSLDSDSNDPTLPTTMMRTDLTLISMDPTAITPFFSNSFLDVLSLVSCPTAGFSYPNAIYLHLENISEDEDFADTIISVDPSEVYIYDCPGMSDFTLGALGHSINGGLCHALRVLEVDGKTHITPHGLKRLVEGRRRISDTYYKAKGIAAEDIPSFMDHDDYEFPDNANGPSPLMTLNISCPGYVLPTDYRKFFEKSVCEFKWHAHDSFTVRLFK